MIKFIIYFSTFTGTIQPLYDLSHKVEKNVEPLIQHFNSDLGYNTSGIITVGLNVPTNSELTTCLYSAHIKCEKDKQRVRDLATTIKEKFNNSTIKVEFSHVDMEEL
jgi:hypothetical protein